MSARSEAAQMSRNPASDQAFALGTLARELARPAHGLGPLARLFFRWLLEMSARFHLAEKAFALHLLFQCAQGLFDIVVADDDLNDGSVSFVSGAPHARRIVCCGPRGPMIG